MRFAMVAGEASGDLLGAAFIEAMRKHYPDASFEGIGGERMMALGFKSFFPLERLSVMGLVEPVKRLPELLRIRAFLRKYFISSPPDIFIGIDAPDFNLSLEYHIRRAGIKTVHYVSPSVWAWRQRRIKKIKKSVDLMLTLFPFEERIYHENKIPVVCVGHFIADQIELNPSAREARKKLGLSEFGKHYVALLPGSRSNEIKQLWPTFLQCAHLLRQERSDVEFLVPCVSSARKRQILQKVEQFSHLPLHIYDGDSQLAMLAADVVLMASGTTTLEALLLKKPMVISYKLAWLSYFILSRLVKVKYIGLPNLLAGRKLVPEFIQQDATPGNLCQALNFYLNNDDEGRLLREEFLKIHMLIKRNAAETAAGAVMKLLRD